VEAEWLYEVYGYSLIDSHPSGTENSSTKVQRRFVNAVKGRVLIFRSDVVESKMELNEQKDFYIRTINVDIREAISIDCLYIFLVHFYYNGL
jgi:hypothetical protein